MQNPGSITVRVKDGSLKCGDLDVECNYGDKVRQLKQMISAKSPMHPDISDQRLIYSGHMLGDDQTLKDVFTVNGELSQSSYTVHLAYRGLGRFTQQSTSSQSTASKASERTTPNPNMPAGSPGIGNFSIPYHPGQQDFQRIQMGLNPDIIALHEFYVRQMMTYMLHWSQFTMQMIQPTATVDAANTPRSYVIPQPVIPQEPINPLRNPAAEVPANARINEVANRGEEEEGAPRDVLDWTYALVRVALIFSLVYFYSNFTRFFLVVLFTALVMIFQRRQVGRRGENPAEHHREAAANVPPPRPNPANERAPEEAPREGTSGDNDNANNPNDNSNQPESPSEDANINAGNANVAASEPRRNFRDITWTFLTTFFTSLIPEVPQNN